MKKIGFILILTLWLSAVAPAQNASQTLPADFKSDNCSLFPDCDYADCCVEHDKAYYFGGSWKERWRADKKLFHCVAAKNGWQHRMIIAPVMWLGVRVFGAPFLPTSFRWGFGHAVKPRKKKIPRAKKARI